MNLADLDLAPGFSGRIRCDPDWHLDARWSRELRDYDLWYVWAGRGRMTTSDGLIDLYPGRGLWMRPSRRYEAEQEPDDRLGVTFIHFQLERKGRCLPAASCIPPVEVFEAKNPDYFNVATTHVSSLIAAGKFKPAGALLLKSLLLEVLSQGGEASQRAGLEKHHRERIDRASASMRERLTSPPTMRELAAESGYSADYFARIFRQVTGLSPKEFIVRARMERAAALLRESSQTVSQISDALGYQEISFFSRQFKQKFGVSPARFRQK